MLTEETRFVLFDFQPLPELINHFLVKLLKAVVDWTASLSLSESVNYSQYTRTITTNISIKTNNVCARNVLKIVAVHLTECHMPTNYVIGY